MKYLIALLFGSVFAFSQIVPAGQFVPVLLTEHEYIEQILYSATGILYKQGEDGTMNMLCTVTAIEKTEKGYRFVTAAHCVADDDEEHKKVDVRKTFFFITLDTAGSKEFLKAKVIVAGYQHRGDDFSLLDTETDTKIPIVALGDDVVSHDSHPVINIAAPQGLGKQVFRGAVSSPKLDRSVVSNDINWTDAMLLQMPGTNGGSSGSTVISLEQRAVCGFLVGSIGGTSIVAIPVSKFKKFYKAFKDDKYKWYESED
jgi:S1-C subfamily serine protease